MTKFSINEQLNNENQEDKTNTLRNHPSSSASSSSMITPSSTIQSTNHNGNHQISSSNHLTNNNNNNSVDPPIRLHNQFYQNQQQRLSSATTMFNNNNNSIWRAEADGSEEQQMRFSFMSNSSNNSPNNNNNNGNTISQPQTTLFGAQNQLSENRNGFDSGSLYSSSIFANTMTADNDDRRPFPNYFSNNNTSNNIVNSNRKSNSNQELWRNSMPDLVFSFQKLLKSNESQQQSLKIDQNINDTNQSRGKMTSQDNGKSKKTLNFDFCSPPIQQQQQQQQQFRPTIPSDYNPHRYNGCISRNNKNRKQQTTNINNHNPNNFYEQSYNMNHWENKFNGNIPESRIEPRNDAGPFVRQTERLINPTNTNEDIPWQNNQNIYENSDLFDPNISCGNPVDLDYFRLMNQQVYQLLMLQNYQINQQHQLIMSWIQCQQEWLRKNSSNLSRDSIMHNNNLATNVGNAENGSNSGRILLSNNHHHTLNNQTVPGVRANNFWDNFKSRSFPNKLQTNFTSNRDQQYRPTSMSTATTATDRENLSTHGNCNNSCQNVGLCNKNSRSHSFPGFSDDSETFNCSSSPNKFKILSRNNLNNSPYNNNNRSTNNANHPNRHTSNNNNNNDKQLVKLLSMIEKLIENQQNSSGNENDLQQPEPSASTSNVDYNGGDFDSSTGLKRKKPSNLETNLADLPEDACECDIEHVNVGVDPDCLEDDDHDSIDMSTSSSNLDVVQQQRKISSSPRNKSKLYTGLDLEVIFPKFKDFKPQQQNDDNHNSDNNYRHLHKNNETIRPLMAAEGRSSELSTNLVPIVSTAYKLPRNSTQKIAFRPPITGSNESSNNNFSISTKPKSSSNDDSKWKRFSDFPSSSSNISNQSSDNQTNLTNDSSNNEDGINETTAFDEDDSLLSITAVNNDESLLNGDNRSKITSSTSSMSVSSTSGDSLVAEGNVNLSQSNISRIIESPDRMARCEDPIIASIRLDDHSNEDQGDDDGDDDDDEDKDEAEIRMLPIVVNGNANEVRSSIRLSGDGEQGL